MKKSCCGIKKCCIFALAKHTVDVAQLVRVPDCGSVGRGFESHLPPSKAFRVKVGTFFYCLPQLGLIIKTF